MRLRAKKLEKAIRKAARARLRGSKPLWKEYRAARKGRAQWRHELERWGAAFIILVFITVHAALRRDTHVCLVAGLGLYGTGTVLLRSIALRHRLFSSSELSFFALYPVRDAQVFDHQWEESFTASLFLPIAFLASFGGLALQVTHNILIIGMGLALAVLLWISIVSLFTLLAMWPPSRWFYPCGLLLNTIGIAVSIWPVPAFPAKVVSSISTLMPAGWLLRAFVEGVLGKNPIQLLWAVPTAALVCALPLFRGRLRENYHFDALPESLLAGVVESQEDCAVDNSKRVEFGDGRANIRQALRQQPGEEWRHLERIASALLSRRSKSVLHFQAGGFFSLNKRWRSSALVLAAGVLLLPFARMMPTWVLFAPLVISGMFGLPILGGRWQGMNLTTRHLFLTPPVAIYPVSYWELSVPIFLCNMIMILGWLPLGAAYTALLAWRLGANPVLWMTVISEVILVVLAWQPIAVFCKFAHFTDAKRIRLLQAPVYLLIFFLGLAFLGATWILLLLPEDSWRIQGCIPTMFLASSLAWAIYGWLYNHSKIDLITTSNED
jgi:hypothetical protein